MSKISINSKDLFKAVQLVGACVKQKNTLPILDNLLFKISEGKLIIIADNLEIRTQVEITIDYVGKIEACIPYKLLTDILKGLPNAPVELSFNDFEVSIKSISGLYNIPIVKADEFPVPNELEETESVKFNALELVEVLRKSMLFGDKDASNMLGFSNILIKIGEENTKVASVESIAFYEYSLDIQGNPCELLLSRETAKYLIQTITKDDDLEINYTDSHLMFKLEDRLIYAIQPQGKFPNYSRILEKVKTDKVLKIDKDIILSSAKRLQAITDSDNTMVLFDLKSNELELSFNNKNFKYSAKEDLVCDYDNEALKFGMNVNYLVNVLATLDNDVIVEFSDESKPCLFYAENTVVLLAPMKL